MTFECDHIRFTRGGKPFFPKICQEKRPQDLAPYNVATVFLDCGLSSSLDWSLAKEEATRLTQSGKALLWDLGFGLDDTSVCHQAALSSFLLAVRSFTEELFLPFQEETFGACLYRGLPLGSFKWNAQHEEAFTDWQEEYGAFPMAKELYQMEYFSEYLHRLAAALPEEALPFALFKMPLLSPALLAQLLSRQHFSYLYLGLQNQDLPIGPFNPETEKARVGVTLPLHSHCLEKSVQALDACIQELRKQKISFRLVSESHLTECWDGLDDLILFSEFLSAQGRRKAQGFAAAGGRLVVQGPPLELAQEISWEEFRGRGI